MNLKFNNKNDIDYHDKALVYLKEKNDLHIKFFSTVRLYNLLASKKDYSLSFIISQTKNDFTGVSWSSDVGTSGFDNFRLQTDEFIPSLVSNENIDVNLENFKYTLKNNKENGLNFIKLCARPEYFKEFVSKYKTQITAYAPLGEKVEREEYNDYSVTHTEYVDAVYKQDVKKLYYMLEEFKDIANQYSPYDKVSINFERGLNLKENMIKSISFITDKKEEKFEWEYPITFRMSNMLAKDGKEVDIKDINNLNHILFITNTPEGWVKFDKSILEDYYDEFSKICLHNQLNNDLTQIRAVKSHKI